MSLWWTKRDHLDEAQIGLIEDLGLGGSHLILGPPGSGKTNVLLRRAQFVRTQQKTNTMVLTFTRSLTEFLKTGCYNADGKEIFPRSCISTIEAWIRGLYRHHGKPLPEPTRDIAEWKANLADGAIELASAGKLKQFDTLFVDEAQDLIPQEVALLRAWSPVLFFVGDDRQKIYEHATGLDSIRALEPAPSEHTLPFHYRLTEELCAMADRVLQTESGASLSKTSHYKGPTPGHIEAHGPLSREAQISEAISRLRSQLRAYNDLLAQGDLLGVIVPRKVDRDAVLTACERDERLSGKAQIVRARSDDEDDRDYDPKIDRDRPIAILTEQGSKGLEFRAVHWLFVDMFGHKRKNETYYTVITRAKTSLDIYYNGDLPQTLALAYSPPSDDLW